MEAIATERLRIVRLPLDAAEAIVEGRCPEGANWADGYPADSTLVAAAMLVTAAAENRDLGPWTAYQAVRAADGCVVAGLGFLEPPDADGVVHIGFSETQAARAGDLLPEAIAALAAWAKDQPEVTRVLADAAPTNRRAITLFEAAGMRQVGADHRLLYFEI